MVRNWADIEIDRRSRAYQPVQPVRKLDADSRLENFDEIYFNYEAEIAMIEASRCIQCPDPAPCQLACALHNDIPTAMRLVEEGRFVEAANVFRLTSPMPEICSRVCPQERLCEGSCTHGGGHSCSPIQIGKIEKFVIEYQLVTEGLPVGEVAPDTDRRISIVGGGPAGLAVAEKLRRNGHAVTVYDANPYPGGLMIYGIPAFKLSKDRVVRKVKQLEQIGVKFVTNTRVGEDVSLQQLLDESDAVFLGVGSNKPAPSRWEGSDLEGIYLANEYLIRTNVPKPLQPEELANQDRPPIGERIFVIGGGDTAMDCVRTSLRLQCAMGLERDVTCAYRRTEAEMPGCKVERENAREEGAKFEWLTAPTRFIGNEDGRLTAVEFVRMALGEPDSSGRRRPVPIEGSEYTVAADTVVLALGYWPETLLSENTEGLETHDWGLITADQSTGRTSLPKLWAGGDAVTGPDLVSTAIYAGLRAADSIEEYLNGTK